MADQEVGSKFGCFYKAYENYALEMTLTQHHHIIYEQV